MTISLAKIVHETNPKSFVRTPFENYSNNTKLIKYDGGRFSTKLNQKSVPKAPKTKSHSRINL